MDRPYFSISSFVFACFVAVIVGLILGFLTDLALTPSQIAAMPWWSASGLIGFSYFLVYASKLKFCIETVVYIVASGVFSYMAWAGYLYLTLG
jgi:hypothetical protein